MMYKYPALLIPADEGGYTVTFRDIPEAITEGDTEEEAKSMALDALVTAMDFYFEDGRPVPQASKPYEGEFVVELPLSVSAKVALLNTRLQSGTRPADVARKMGIKPQEMTRVFDLHHATKIDTIAAAMAAMNAKLRVVVDPEASYVFDVRSPENVKKILKVTEDTPQCILMVPWDNLNAQPIRGMACIEKYQGSDVVNKNGFMRILVSGNSFPMDIDVDDVPCVIENAKNRLHKANA